MIASFSEHVLLLSVFLDRRARITDDIEQRLLNVQGKAAARNRNRADVERVFSACFFEVEGLPRALSQLKGQLASEHAADGFEAVTLERGSHQLDAVELIFRAYDHWDRHRWPGRNGRLVFAQTLYCVYLFHHLEQLSLRIWDEGNDQPGKRLRDVQSLLDTLNAAPGSNVESKLARVRGWQRLHERTGGKDHIEYSHDWAKQVRDHTATALSARLTHADALNASALPHARLFVLSESVDAQSSSAAIPDGVVSAQEHCVTSDLQRALATGATAFPKNQILLDRKEGRFLASVEVDGKWFGVSKVLLTACTSQGKHALITGVPEPVIEVLRLTCPDLLVVVSR